MTPTYTFHEVMDLLCELDYEGLEILHELLLDEQHLYTLRQAVVIWAVHERMMNYYKNIA